MHSRANPSPGRPGRPNHCYSHCRATRSRSESSRLARRHPGVVVQGPPGTGKSHTITNLISHHVAYGRRVLVVAEKEQALKVLADKGPSGNP